MALIVTAFDLVARVDALPGGAEALAQAAPNNTFCTDNVLARLSFMNLEDRERFVSGMSAVWDGSLARVDKRTLVSDAEWLRCGRYAGVDAVWLDGAPPGPLVVPVNWTPGDLEFATWDEVKDHLEYIGVQGNVEVYIDKRTGKKLYTGRTQPAIPPAERERLDALWEKACGLASPLVIDRHERLGFFEKRKVNKAVAMFKELLMKLPDSWSVRWFLGMSLRALEDQANALTHFRVAYAGNTENPDVGREYAAQCSIVGDRAEAIRVGRELHARFPDNPGLQANLALALLIGGDLGEALAVATAALERDPADEITKNLVGYIQDVRDGRKARPTRMPGT